MSDRVRVAYTKYDGSLHYHKTALRLGEDQHGTWLGAPSGTVMRKGEDGPPIVSPVANVLLLPRVGWWAATFYDAPFHLNVYCDIATPARWLGPDSVTMIDLDLDVGLRRATGRVERYDEDEFADNSRRYGYPDEVVTQASAAANWLVTAIAARRGPFDGAHQPWLDLLTS
ncbi:DUF402 domain-containing protein [Plantactinospora sp. KBS50]|uniref:DUF402 domain-containing protein n=1 Tax=Plantactinospora sp. KBS50 TaxID=2024580 RepID=UPI000BAAD91E|nr:DUF402 domain-containing protein [Plantactinospora sp. KBS50]ASW53672.1 hypothetical protein CIK06_04895 [Plantactinospora sp. KBS50]